MFKAEAVVAKLYSEGPGTRGGNALLDATGHSITPYKVLHKKKGPCSS